MDRLVAVETCQHVSAIYASTCCLVGCRGFREFLFLLVSRSEPILCGRGCTLIEVTLHTGWVEEPQGNQIMARGNES